MPCTPTTLPDGSHAIVCTPTQRCKCGARATLQCDWKVPTRRSGVCDRYICASCSTKPAPHKDLCREHAVTWERWKAARAASIGS